MIIFSCIVFTNLNLQAAWIVDDSDVDNSDVDNSNSDVDAEDDMVLDERNTNIHGQDMLQNYDDDDDNKTFVSLNDRESDQESEVDSVMMVSLHSLLCIMITYCLVEDKYQTP